MTDRLKALRRVLAVQTQAKRLAESRLAGLESRQRELDTLGRDLDGFLDAAGLTGNLAILGLRQRRRLSATQVATEAERAAQVEATRDARSREKIADRMVEDVAAQERREQDKRELERLIEGLAARGPNPAGA